MGSRGIIRKGLQRLGLLPKVEPVEGKDDNQRELLGKRAIGLSHAFELGESAGLEVYEETCYCACEIREGKRTKSDGE